MTFPDPMIEIINTQSSEVSTAGADSLTSETPVGNVAFIKKLKALSKKHVSDMEGKSDETCKTEDETPPTSPETQPPSPAYSKKNDLENFEINKKLFQSCKEENVVGIENQNNPSFSLLPDFVSSFQNFDIGKYTDRMTSSLSLCNSAACGSTRDIVQENDMDFIDTIRGNRSKKHKGMNDKYKNKTSRENFLDARARNRRREREERANEFNCTDIIVSDDFSISQVSGITMQTLQVQDFQRGLHSRRENRERKQKKATTINKHSSNGINKNTNMNASNTEEEMKTIRNLLIAKSGKQDIYGDGMSLNAAVTTLHTISKEFGVPPKVLLNDQGLRQYLQRSG